MASSVRPVSIYLDVDGVVNPFSPVGTTDWGGDWCIADAGILEVAFAPEVVEALNDLADTDARKARIVELKFFGGLTTEEIAHHLDVSTATVERDWKFARAWLYRAVSGSDEGT